MEDMHLTYPVTVGERTVTDLHFNDPQLMHMMRTDGHNINDIGADVELVSALTEFILKTGHRYGFNCKKFMPYFSA